jgi:hypothetical protein
MLLHLRHAERGFGVTFNDITKDAAFYSSSSRFVAWLGTFPAFPQPGHQPLDDLADSSSWSLPPLVLLREIHANRLANYDCKGSAPCKSQSGKSGTGDRWTLAACRTGFRSNTRPALAFFRNSTTASRHIPCGERTPPTFLSPPSRLIASTGSRFRVLQQILAVSHRAEQLRLQVTAHRRRCRRLDAAY